MDKKIRKAVLGADSAESSRAAVDCLDAQGKLPVCAALAVPYVPVQQENPVRYEPPKAMVRGTLFPGLDLPYLGMVNETEMKDEGLAQLQALAFAIQELGLYLDTHAEDRDAAELFASYVSLYQQGLHCYEQEHGALLQMHAVRDGAYTWTQGPWPWEISANQEG